MTPEQSVRDFCKAVEGGEVEPLLARFTDDAVDHNIPMAPVVGREAIRATLEGFLSPGAETRFEILAIATTGRTVLTERMDTLTIGEKRIVLPVMGAFDLAPDGRIAAWRDYWDMQQFTAQMA